jgi:hypothetical protein
MCFTSCMLIQRPAYHINERVHSCTRGTRSAGPDGPNGTQTKELATVSQNGVVYLAWTCRPASLQLRYFAFPRAELFRSDTSPRTAQSDPGRGEARAGSPRDL